MTEPRVDFDQSARACCDRPLWFGSLPIRRRVALVSITDSRSTSPFRTAARSAGPAASSPQGRALATLESLIATAHNGLPCLHAARDRLLLDTGSVSDADASVLSLSIETAMGQLSLILRLFVTERVLRSAPDEVLLCDLPQLRRQGLDELLAKALEPSARGLRALLSEVVGPLPLPVIGDVRVLAREIVDGLPLGEVRRRATSR